VLLAKIKVIIEMGQSQRNALGLLSVATSVGLVSWLLTRINFERTIALLQQANWSWLSFAAIVTCLIPFASVYRWRGVLAAQDDVHLSYMITLRAVMMANVLNSFLPSKAGDIAKAAYLRKHGGLPKGLGTVILERLVDLGVLGILGIIGLSASGALWGLIAGGILLGGVITVFMLLLAVPITSRLPDKTALVVDKVILVFSHWIRNPSAIIRTLTGSLVIWSIGGLTVYALARGIGAELSLGYTYAIFPLAILAGLIPVTISGIGTRDSAFVMLLSSQLPVEEATLIGIGYTLFAYWFLSLVSFPAVALELNRIYRSGMLDKVTR
jgi:uncharacterized membrane protein YbhN (UPF0104 family)